MSSPNFEKPDFENDMLEEVALDGGSFDGEAIDEGLIESDALEAESDEIGQTTGENSPVAADGSTVETDTEEDPKRRFSVFDAMLLISLICVTLATLLLFFALRDYGDFPFAFPWNTSDT